MSQQTNDRIAGFNEGLATAAAIVKRNWRNETPGGFQRFGDIQTSSTVAEWIMGSTIKVGFTDGYTLVPTADLLKINQLLANSLRLLQEIEQRKQ